MCWDALVYKQFVAGKKDFCKDIALIAEVFLGLLDADIIKAPDGCIGFASVDFTVLS